MGRVHRAMGLVREHLQGSASDPPRGATPRSRGHAPVPCRGHGLQPGKVWGPGASHGPGPVQGTERLCRNGDAGILPGGQEDACQKTALPGDMSTSTKEGAGGKGQQERLPPANGGWPHITHLREQTPAEEGPGASIAGCAPGGGEGFGPG